MTNSLIDSRLRKVLKKTAAPQTGWLDVFPAVIGTASGTVQTGVDGIIYVRNILNGQILSVYNFTVPNTAGLQVEVGRKVETPGLWQVKGVREAYARPAGGSVGSASHTHENLFISPNRYLRFLTLPIEGGGFTVQIYGDVFRNSSGIVTSIANQQLDLSSYVPSSGAKWVVIQADSTGAISVNEGDAVESKELLTLLYIPDPVDDYVESCAVRLYDGQVQLYRDPSSINDFVDLRGLRTWGISLSLDDLLDVSVSVANDGDVLTYDAFYDLWLPVAPTGGGAVDSVNGQTGTVVIDYDSVSSNDGNTDVTGAELEELSDGSETTLHSHAGNDGWLSPSGTWSYSSVDDPTGVITSNADETGIIGLGDRIKLTNGGNTIYGIVTKISYSAPNTTITFLHEIDPTDSLALYLLANSAITNPYYSHAKVPFGFPSELDKWTIVFTDTTNAAQSSPTVNTWYNLGSLSLSAPIGEWKVFSNIVISVLDDLSGGAGYLFARSTISTGTSSASHSDFTRDMGISAGGMSNANLRFSSNVSGLLLSVSSKTTLYLLARTSSSGLISINFRGDLAGLETTVKLRCAYL
ncbi:MAG TPA: hypothetical protein VJ987_05355 [Anaerolineales bacterium]|nr:hypothetical protein [Anaerolineales bacterium]